MSAEVAPSLLSPWGWIRLYRRTRHHLYRLRPSEIMQRAAMARMYGRYVGPGDVVFDIGANLGNRTEIFLRLGATVIAVEPQPRCIRVLKNEFGRNGRLTIEPTALGRETGHIMMQVGSTHVLSTTNPQWLDRVQASGRYKQTDWSQQIEVPMNTLDRLIERHGKPRFCKIDVEGSESEVLSGLSQPIDGFSFEYIPEFRENSIACVDQLQDLADYEYNFSRGETMRYEFGYWLDADGIREQLGNPPDDGFAGDVYARVK